MAGGAFHHISADSVAASKSESHKGMENSVRTGLAK
jgi:hypothetical protein